MNEGPEILRHGDKLFLIYSASGCWTNSYELGMAAASASSDLLNASSWRKAALPVFWESPAAHAYGTGHNGFFKSPDGKEDWIVYHANPESNQGCGGKRSPRAQPFTWNADGTPDLGRPTLLAKQSRRLQASPRASHRPLLLLLLLLRMQQFRLLIFLQELRPFFIGGELLIGRKHRVRRSDAHPDLQLRLG